MSNKINPHGRPKPRPVERDLISPDLTSELVAYRPVFEKAQRLLFGCRRLPHPLTHTERKYAIYYAGFDYDGRPLNLEDRIFIDHADKQFMQIVSQSPCLKPRIDIRSEFTYTISFNL